MIIDSSAVLAVLLGEPEKAAMIEALEANSPIRISAASYLEVFITLESRKVSALEGQFENLLSDYSVVVEPVTRSQVALGRLAYRSYGKPSGHQARLNYGDCFTYALAAEFYEPLLCKGDDFIHTDLKLIALAIDNEGI